MNINSDKTKTAIAELPMHFISAKQVTPDGLIELCKNAEQIKKTPADYQDRLKGKVACTLFFEPSTRTRLSFESAVQRLGMMLISTENARENTSDIKGESLQDTIRIAQCNSDCIIMRHQDDDAHQRVIPFAKVPIVNAGSGKQEHPTQGLLDVYTVYLHKRHLDGLSVAIIGDLKYGRTSHSFIRLLSMYPKLSVYGLSDDNLRLPQEYIDELKKSGAKYTEVSSFKELPSDIDALYQTRVQHERISGLDNLKTFDITPSVMQRFSKDTLIMHPLPRLNELSSELDLDSRAVYFEQVQNGLYIRQALLLDLMVDKKIIQTTLGC